MNRGPIDLQSIALPLSYTPSPVVILHCKVYEHESRSLQILSKVLSDVGFEPTPSYEDQNSHFNSLSESKGNLESGALDHSANLTVELDWPKSDPGQARTGDLLRVKQM